MKNLNSNNYNIKPYTRKHLFLFVYGLYFEDTLLYWGGFHRIVELQNAMNAAVLVGIMHAITINS